MDGAAAPTRALVESAPVVAYEADLIDPVQRLGWSVTVTGRARPITGPARIARYQLALQPWVDQVMDTVIGIGIWADIVTGFRLLVAG